MLDKVYDFEDLGRQKVVEVKWEIHSETATYTFTDIVSLNRFMRTTNETKLAVSTLFRVETGQYRGYDWFDLVKFNDWWIVTN